MAYCIKCGKQNSDLSKFCTGCGAIMSNVSAPLGQNEPFPIISKSDEATASKKKKVSIIVAIVIFLGLGAGVYFLFFYKDTQKKRQTENISKDSVITDHKANSNPASLRLKDSVTTEKSREQKTTAHYYGTIGNYPIQMELTKTGVYECDSNGNSYAGNYFYEKSGSSNTIIIKGYNCGNNIYLTEYYPNGNSNGIFTGRLNGNTINGVFNSGKKYNFILVEK